LNIYLSFTTLCITSAKLVTNYKKLPVSPPAVISLYGHGLYIETGDLRRYASCAVQFMQESEKDGCWYSYINKGYVFNQEPI
jgi:hypothetical protein